MKHIKMLVYGEPGVGKSVFASKSPKPFFITTDGNYEWLEDFGAKEEDHIQVESWEEAKKIFNDNFDNYETIVVDLLEDLFKWCEQEYCKRGRIDHVSDIGFGKGYDITRNEFFLEISKLLNKNKNVILITHGITFETKDRRGVAHTKHAPSSRIPDKVLDMIEGRLRYCLRAYLKAEEQPDGTLKKERYLSLVPKENEFGICRGIDENKVPHDIPLDWNEFAKILGITNNTTEIKQHVEEVVEENIKVEKQVEEQVKEQVEEPTKTVTINENIANQTEQVIIEKVEETEESTNKSEETKVLTNEDKMAAIKAKLDAMKAMNN